MLLRSFYVGFAKLETLQAWRREPAAINFPGGVPDKILGRELLGI